MNKTIISGRLTKDPVMKIIQSNGKDVLVARGRRLFTSEVVAEHMEFAESKKSNEALNVKLEESGQNEADDGFMDIPDGYDLPLPFDN